jgi:quercetin dioxygenase-like cupin family protein
VLFDDHGPDPVAYPGLARVVGQSIWREPDALDPSSGVNGAQPLPSFPTKGSQLTLLRFERNASIPAHATASIDYLIVLAGEIACILDDGEFTARAGDVVVQRGSRHAWHNRGEVPYVGLFAIRVHRPPEPD